MNEQDIYDRICGGRFNKIDKDNASILKILKGDNGDGTEIGLCERVRNQNTRLVAIEDEHLTVKKTIKRYFRWAGGIVGGWWLLGKAPEIINWIKNAL